MTVASPDRNQRARWLPKQNWVLTKRECPTDCILSPLRRQLRPIDRGVVSSGIPFTAVYCAAFSFVGQRAELPRDVLRGSSPLENVPKPYLESARIGGRLLNHFAKLAGGRSEVQATSLSDLGPVGMIDKVIGFGAELEHGFSIHGELFTHIEIPILEPGTVNLVAYSRLQVEGACSRLGK